MNPGTIDQAQSAEQLAKENEALREEIARLKKTKRKAARRYRHEEELKPYQAELIRMQQHLEQTKTRMVILFEGRDAAGKGGRHRIRKYLSAQIGCTGRNGCRMVVHFPAST